MLWVATVYLLKEAKFHYIAGIPALFMTGVVGTYFLYAPETLNLDYGISVIGGLIPVAVTGYLYVRAILKQRTAEVKDPAYEH